MNKNKKFWLYITLGALVLLLLFWLVFVSYNNRITLSLTSYFFLLVICSLAVTAFLSGALNSAADWQGSFYNGNLKLAGPAVIFFILVIAGYQFRPQPQNSPFDLTIFLTDSSSVYQPSATDKMIIENGNDRQESAVGEHGRVAFPNVNASYRGASIIVAANLEEYTIASRADTVLTVPDDANPVIHLTLRRKQDSTLFSGIVVSGKDESVANAVIQFPSFQKKIVTGADGVFSVYLPAREGDKTNILIVQNRKVRYDNKIILSSGIKIPLP